MEIGFPYKASLLLVKSPHGVGRMWVIFCDPRASLQWMGWKEFPFGWDGKDTLLDGNNILLEG